MDQHGDTPADASPAPRGGLLVYVRRALALVWSADPRLAIALGTLTALAGFMPASIAYVGQLIVDGVVAAADGVGDAAAERRAAIGFVILECGLVILQAALQRGIAYCQALLRELLSQHVNVMILEKALTLSLAQFEDAEFYDKLTRARREASTRPLSLVNRTFLLAQYGVSLLSLGVLLVQFSPWAALLVLVAGLPEFIGESRFAQAAYEISRRRSPDRRKRMYLETVLAREDHAKEVKLFGLGPLLLDRYDKIFQGIFREDRALARRREGWGFALGLISTLGLYGTYTWIATAAMFQRITLGEMTMYLLVFKQGQSTVASILNAVNGMYEDNLYLSNLYEYLEQDAPPSGGAVKVGVEPGDGIRFEAVEFGYPGAATPSLSGIDLHVPPGTSLALVGENGAGKTTLIKLMTGLYPPNRGRVLLDGTPVTDWDRTTLNRRIGVIFQDFNRYQMLVGENIGAGDTNAFGDELRWHEAAQQGLAAEFIDKLADKYSTQLGNWFANGQELSIGQWQKVALARAFMAQDADILILDEPTAAVDAVAEAALFERFQSLAEGRMKVLISHRFSTVRRAEHIVVLEHGRITEQGSHDELLALAGQYARMFELQAEGYR